VTSSTENQVNITGSNRNQEYLDSVRQMVDYAGNLAYSHTTVFLLLVHSRGNVVIKDDLSMEGVLL